MDTQPVAEKKPNKRSITKTTKPKLDAEHQQEQYIESIDDSSRQPIDLQAVQRNKNKEAIIRMCMNLQPPLSQTVMDYIKQITGHYMLEDNSNYHIQYDTGVSVDLN